jgi:hypothetical protein
MPCAWLEQAFFEVQESHLAYVHIAVGLHGNVHQQLCACGPHIKALRCL